MERRPIEPTPDTRVAGAIPELGGRPLSVRAGRVEVVGPPLEPPEKVGPVEVATPLLARVETDLAVPGHEVALVIVLAAVATSTAATETAAVLPVEAP